MIFIDRQFADALPKLLASAERTINVTIYAMSPLTPTTHPRHRALTRALIDTKKRGLRCQAIIALLQPNTPGSNANHMSASMLIDGGWHVKAARATPILHTKTLILDDHTAVVGSHNWTDSALHMNRETSVLISDRIDVTRLLQMFDTLWAAAAPWPR